MHTYMSGFYNVNSPHLLKQFSLKICTYLHTNKFPSKNYFIETNPSLSFFKDFPPHNGVFPVWCKCSVCLVALPLMNGMWGGISEITADHKGLIASWNGDTDHRISVFIPEVFTGTVQGWHCTYVHTYVLYTHGSKGIYVRTQWGLEFLYTVGPLHQGHFENLILVLIVEVSTIQRWQQRDPTVVCTLMNVLYLRVAPYYILYYTILCIYTDVCIYDIPIHLVCASGYVHT